MKLSRVSNNALFAFQLLPPPGHKPLPWGHRGLYINEDDDQLYLLTDARRDELDPRWKQGQ